jgi:hypothetical protein
MSDAQGRNYLPEASAMQAQKETKIIMHSSARKTNPNPIVVDIDHLHKTLDACLFYQWDVFEP